jgi:DNA-binding IclR family transcriptional regulator
VTAAQSPSGSQTLARGLRALEYVAQTPDGLSILEIAERLGVHRSIASRLLATLSEFNLVVRGADGRYHVGVGVAALSSAVHTTLRVTAEPIMRELADRLGATISLLVAEGDEAVALSVVSPQSSTYHLAFRTGARHPIDRAAGGIALLAAQPPRPGESPRVTQARERGYATTVGEVEPDAHGIAVPLPPTPGVPTACLNLITHRAEIAANAAPELIAAAAHLAAALR